MNTERKILYSANRHYEGLAKIGNVETKIFQKLKLSKMSKNKKCLLKFHKVQVFLEAHKSLTNRPQGLTLLSNVKTSQGLCGLLRMSEL